MNSRNYRPQESKILGKVLLEAFRKEAERSLALDPGKGKDKAMSRVREIQNLFKITGKGKYWKEES